MVRSSHKELNSKIKNAITCLERNNYCFENPTQFSRDALELNLSFISGDLLEVIKEVKPEYYIGKKPPEKSYESKILNCDLFAFKWESEFLQETVYLKFALNQNVLWLSSLHKDRPSGRA